jgi:hypothetical protein
MLLVRVASEEEERHGSKISEEHESAQDVPIPLFVVLKIIGLNELP